MKKIINGVLAFVFVLGLFLSNGSQTVIANPGSGLAPGDWMLPSNVTGTTVSVTASGAPSYLQLLTVGIKISEPAKICHSFKGATYGWEGEIRELKSKLWVRITTNLVVNSAEGVFNVCANAPEAGTYALFAVFTGTAIPVSGAETAASGTGPSEGDGPGNWNTGNIVNLNMGSTPPPAEFQLLSTGIKVTQSGQICHPFDKGREGWVGQIRELKNGNWVLLKTTSAWVPTEEGKYMACAQAPEAGIYALFGTY